MSDYQKKIKEEAKVFYDSAQTDYAADDGEFGAKSERPNLAMWIDRQGKLADRIQEISSKWSHKEVLWVQSNTRNRSPGGGDPQGHAFASFLKDVRHEIKKLAKAAK